jgi:hypothetical protein
MHLNTIFFTAKPQEKLADPPRFITHPLGLRLNDGDPATLECQISGTKLQELGISIIF